MAGIRSSPGDARPAWSFWVDRGGTFTDCIGRGPGGRLAHCKLLSSDAGPVEGIRRILEAERAIGPGDPLPPCEVKLGSTVATNALLERRGVPTLLVTNRGLGDVLRIGTQERPLLFALEIRRPEPLHDRVIECSGRVSVNGDAVASISAYHHALVMRPWDLRARLITFCSSLVMLRGYNRFPSRYKLSSQYGSICVERGCQESSTLVTASE